jgi:ATP-dependent helicase HrpA
MIAHVQDLEHKARRQDVLVDDELIYAFYDQQLPADICTGAGCESWYKTEVKKQPNLLILTQDELMRHEAAGITSQAFPKTLRLGGVDCLTTYLHEPGDARDGVTVEVPIFALNQVNEERCEWLVPGMLKDKIQALIKTLHQPHGDGADAAREIRRGFADGCGAEMGARRHVAGHQAGRPEAGHAACPPVHELPGGR